MIFVESRFFGFSVLLKRKFYSGSCLAASWKGIRGDESDQYAQTYLRKETIRRRERDKLQSRSTSHYNLDVHSKNQLVTGKVNNPFVHGGDAAYPHLYGTYISEKGIGVHPTGYYDENGKYVLVKEMIPEFIVPDLRDFKLTPYVDYSVPLELPAELAEEQKTLSTPEGLLAKFNESTRRDRLKLLTDEQIDERIAEIDKFEEDEMRRLKEEALEEKSPKSRQTIKDIVTRRNELGEHSLRAQIDTDVIVKKVPPARKIGRRGRQRLPEFENMDHASREWVDTEQDARERYWRQTDRRAKKKKWG